MLENMYTQVQSIAFMYTEKHVYRKTIHCTSAYRKTCMPMCNPLYFRIPASRQPHIGKSLALYNPRPIQGIFCYKNLITTPGYFYRRKLQDRLAKITPENSKHERKVKSMKEYDVLSPLDAAKLLESNREGAGRYFRNMVRNAQRRAATFKKHDRTDAYGYERLRSALSIAKHGMSAETISYLSQTLASKRTSYAESRSIDLRTIHTLQEEFGKDFITEADLPEFGKAMEAFRNSHIAMMYGSDSIAQDIMQEIRSGHVKNWHEYFINYEKEGSVK